MRFVLDDLPALALFARVVHHGSFTAAAREAGLATSAVSQRLARLEGRLGVQLLRRSTRALQLTDDGMRLFQQAAALVDVARSADDALAEGDAPRGVIKLNAPSTIHRGQLADALGAFLERHPAVSLQVTLDDRLVDLVLGDFDVLLRVIPPRARSSVARKLGTLRIVVVGAPAYLDASPPLATPYDLVQHACLRNAAIPARIDWRLNARGRSYTVPIRSRFETADFVLLHEAALAGMGLLVTLEPTVAADLRAGRLRRVLESYTGPPLDLYAIVAERAGGPRRNRARRALVDHLAKVFRSARAAARPRSPAG